VHTSAEASESVRSLDALAYTSGRDIYFASGMYSPASSSGRRLLAHEVAHVVQQGSGKEPSVAMASRGVKIGAPEDMLEGEAERAAEAFMSATPGELADDEQLKRPEAGVTVQRFIQRQDAGAPAPAPASAPATAPTPAPGPAPATQPTTTLDATAQSIIRGAADTSRDAGARAVEAVWRIIKEYYSGKASNVNVVSYDNPKAGTGLATAPYPESKPTSGKIFVGDRFLTGVQDRKTFAHRVLQVGHELEHIDQFLAPALGPSAAKKDEREFLAFYHEALATEVPHTGRFQHSNRIDVIDAALGYYNCLASAAEQDKKDAAKRYESSQKELLTRRTAEINEMKKRGYTNVPTDAPPKECKRQ
jgi:hypothetical protein